MSEVKDVLTASHPEIYFDSKFVQMIKKIILDFFPNGFRLDSPIELIRLRRFSLQNFGNELPMNDEELIKFISLCGSPFDGKIYIIDNEVENGIKNKVDFIISNGAEIIFYNLFYMKHEELLFAGNVVSEKMLKDMLVRLYPNYQHKANYFSPKITKGTESSKIKSEILRVWGNDTILNYEQLIERLPYIPLDKIKCVLAQNSDFLWNNTGAYTHISKIDVNNEECTPIINYVADACRTNGYASINDVPLGEIEERNCELTLTAIHNAVFEILLADKYAKRGKIITCKGDTLDAFTIIKIYCSMLDKISLEELLNFERELTGESHRWAPMEAGYSVMVRAEEHNYISEKYVNFDIAKIDSVLDLFIVDNYLPLKSVTTFAAFPHCGQAWNLFLLESYCRRFSDKFRFDVLAVNSKNAGAIIRKDCRLTYHQIMIDAVSKSDIPLEKVPIEGFLYTKGYLGKRSYAKIQDLIEQAKAKRERRY